MNPFVGGYTPIPLYSEMGRTRVEELGFEPRVVQRCRGAGLATLGQLMQCTEMALRTKGLGRKSIRHIQQMLQIDLGLQLPSQEEVGRTIKRRKFKKRNSTR